MALRPIAAGQSAVFKVTGGTVTGQAANFSVKSIAYPSATTSSGAGTWIELDSTNLPGYYSLSLSMLVALPVTDRSIVIVPASTVGAHVFTPTALVVYLSPTWEETLLKGTFSASESLAAIRTLLNNSMLPIVRDD